MSGAGTRKRSATEAAALLTGAGAAAGALRRRPVATQLGAAFVFGRGVAGLLWVGSFVLLWPELSAQERLQPDVSSLVFWIVVTVGVLAPLVAILVAWAIWRGSNLARVLVMVAVTGSTISAAIGYFANGETITIHTTLLTVALDILVLLALSGREARAWAQHPSRSHRRG